ncbi:MAG: CysO-cysteine peptidase, partial [uncultured Friedmanniella sp.]
AEHRPRPCRGHDRPRPRRPPGRGVRGDRRAGRVGHPDAVRAHDERGPVADLLPVRPHRAAPALPGDGRRGRGDRRGLPLPHRDRGLPVAHRHRLRRRAAGALRPGLDRRVRDGGGPGLGALLPDPRRPGQRGRADDRGI